MSQLWASNIQSTSIHHTGYHLDTQQVDGISSSLTMSNIDIPIQDLTPFTPMLNDIAGNQSGRLT